MADHGAQEHIPVSRHPLESRIGAEGQRLADFVQRVSERAGVERSEAARTALTVLGVLGRHLRGLSRRSLELDLPDRIGELLGRLEAELPENRESFGRAGFFRMVADELKLSPRESGRVVSGVFSAVREEIGREEAARIAEALPPDIRAVWEHRPSNARALAEGERDFRLRRREAHYSQAWGRFVNRLARQARIDDKLAEDAAVSVTCALEQRLTAAEAEDLNAELPARLREVLLRCERHGGKPLKFDLSGLYEMVSDDLELGVDEVVPLVAEVFQVLHEYVSPGEAHDVAAQLPGDIAAVWNEAGRWRGAEERAMGERKEDSRAASQQNAAPAEKPVRTTDPGEAAKWARDVAECEAEGGLD